MELFAHFVARLKATPDGEGSLLDHSMVLYGCGIADSNRHTHERLPAVVMGHGDGSLQSGRHLTLKDDTPIANLYLAMMGRMGVEQERFGDSTGRLEIG